MGIYGEVHMNAEKLIEEIQSSEPYLQWQKETEQHKFLASIFAVVEDEKPINWHVNFYIPGTQKSATFTSAPNIERLADSTMNGDEPVELNVEQAKMSFPEILEKACEALEKKYPRYTYSKILATLHQNENEAQWNIAFLTSQAVTVRFQVRASDGEILSEKTFSIHDFSVLK